MQEDGAGGWMKSQSVFLSKLAFSFSFLFLVLVEG